MIHVAVAVIFNDQGKILIAERPPHKYAPGLWEFPGGKVEKNETVQEALHREIIEEINLTILSARPWLQIHHDYSDRSVLLDVWIIEQFSGEPESMEGQLIKWVSLSELDQFTFPEGNKEIIEKLKLQGSLY